VLLLKAKAQPLFNTTRSEDSWEELATGKLTVINIPGSHEGMFKEPYVHTLAKELTTQLNLAQSAMLEE
jgi:thioesterase domain-containing protein